METTNTKSFWQRPEGLTAKVILGAIAVLFAATGFVYLNTILEFLITLATNTIHLAILAGILIGGYMLVTSERVSTLFFYGLQMISRSLTAMFVDIDPVAILKSFIRDMKKKLEVVDNAVTQMMAARQKLTQQRQQKDREMREALRLAEAAEQTGNEEKLAELTEKVGRRQKAIETLDGGIAFTTETIDALQRVKRVVEYHIANSEDEMNELASQNEAALAITMGVDAAREALGDTDKLEVRNMAADVIRDRISKATGQVESLMQSTKSVQGEIDLTQMAFRADGRAKLDELRAKVQKVEIQQASSPKAIGAGAAQPLQLPAQGSSIMAKRLNRNNH
jgi:phage shock protein A